MPTSDSDVFINCPFDKKYAPLFDALVFVIYACGFRPRSAKEIDDSSEARIDKLYGIIEGCRFSVHDISRTELDGKTKLPRFNMPLELGIDLGAKRFGTSDQKNKRCLILDTRRFRYRKFISDISGMDIHEHLNRQKKIIECVRNWLANVSRRDMPGAELLLKEYRRFKAKLPMLAKNLGFKADEIPYADFEKIVTNWLRPE